MMNKNITEKYFLLTKMLFDENKLNFYVDNIEFESEFIDNGDDKLQIKMNYYLFYINISYIFRHRLENFCKNYNILTKKYWTLLFMMKKIKSKIKLEKLNELNEKYERHNKFADDILKLNKKMVRKNKLKDIL